MDRMNTEKATIVEERTEAAWVGIVSLALGVFGRGQGVAPLSTIVCSECERRSKEANVGRSNRAMHHRHFRVRFGLVTPVGHRPEDQECIETWNNGVRFAVSF